MEIKELTGKDIGHPVLKGSTVNVSNGFDITAGGVDIWDTSDQFHFSYQEQKGDFDFVARIEALSSADLYTKSGILARESLEANCQHVYLFTFPDNSPRNSNNGGVEFQYRTIRGGESKAIYPSVHTKEPPEFPVSFPNTWMRMTRNGDRFDSYYSTSGNRWHLYTSFMLKMNPKIYLGFAVTSHNFKETVTTKVRDVSAVSGASTSDG